VELEKKYSSMEFIEYLILELIKIKEMYTEFILETVYVQDLAFSKIKLLPMVPNLFKHFNKIKKLENSM
jgi:hypothetical protein